MINAHVLPNWYFATNVPEKVRVHNSCNILIEKVKVE